MVFVVGQDSPVLDAICEVIGRGEQGGGEAPHCLRVEPAKLDRGALFASLIATKPAAVVVVDGLARLAGPPGLDEVIDLVQVGGAATGAGVRKLIVVTTREKDDAALKELRRSGIPYVVLRAGSVVQLSADVDRAALAGRKILVHGDVLGASDGGVTAEQIGRAVKDALDRAEVTGRTIPVEPSGDGPAVLALLEEMGAHPVVHDGWRSRLTRWFGRPVAQVAEDGTLCIGRGHARAHAARHAVPEVAHAL